MGLSEGGSLSNAVRTVDRWGLLAGVTGFLGNALLVVLFTTPADGPYAWTGHANDIVGVPVRRCPWAWRYSWPSLSLAGVTGNGQAVQARRSTHGSPVEMSFGPFGMF